MLTSTGARWCGGDRGHGEKLNRSCGVISVLRRIGSNGATYLCSASRRSVVCPRARDLQRYRYDRVPIVGAGTPDNLRILQTRSQHYGANFQRRSERVDQREGGLVPTWNLVPAQRNNNLERRSQRSFNFRSKNDCMGETNVQAHRYDPAGGRVIETRILSCVGSKAPNFPAFCLEAERLEASVLQLGTISDRVGQGTRISA